MLRESTLPSSLIPAFLYVYGKFTCMFFIDSQLMHGCKTLSLQQGVSGYETEMYMSNMAEGRHFVDTTWKQFRPCLLDDGFSRVPNE